MWVIERERERERVRVWHEEETRSRLEAIMLVCLRVKESHMRLCAFLPRSFPSIKGSCGLMVGTVFEQYSC